MVLNTGMRTDIPAYFSEWFINRVREGYVLTRNPYNPMQVNRYRIDPKVVDILCFGTKNPGPLIPYLDELGKFKTYWFVTINPYGRELEPNVPDWRTVAESAKAIAKAYGAKAVSWRYAPICVNDDYPVEWHIEKFREMAEVLGGHVETCMIGFLDLYEKTRKNFPEGRAATKAEKAAIGKAFAEISKAHGIHLIGCYEYQDLAEYGVDVSGCMTHHALEHVGDFHLTIPKSEMSVQKKVGASASITEAEILEHRQNGGCILGRDIGVYNTCPHGCRYCYANYDMEVVMKNFRNHDPKSPYLIGGPMQGEVIRDAKQVSWIDPQMTMFDLL